MIISIVGKSGSGKSYISKTLEELDENILHIDFDLISHFVLTLDEVKRNLIETFGEDIMGNGEVNRKVLGRIVFNEEGAMDKLTDITWPVMERIIDEIINNNKDKIILLDSILIPKTKYFKMSDLRIWVEADDEVRFRRVLKRKGDKNITREYFNDRDRCGVNYTSGDYHFVIDNNDFNHTYEEVNKIYEKCIVSR